MARNILLVEDSQHQFKALASELEEKNWTIIRAQDRNDASYQYDKTLTAGGSVDIAAVDLGLPPGVDNPMHGGIAVIEDLRKRSTALSLPTLAYTTLTPREFDYSLVTKRLLTLRSSFLFLRPMGEKENFTDLIEYAWMGYVILSPVPADFLTSAVSINPDPLDEKLWETLQKLDRGTSYSKIADAMGLTVEGVKARLIKIHDLLVEARELPADAETEDLIRWYREKRVRHSRP